MTTKRSIRERLGATLAAVALSVTLFGVVFAPVTEAACANAQFTIYANTNGGGSHITFCIGNGNIPNLSNVQGTMLFECGLIHGTDWNDCASSARFQELGQDTAVCFWTDANYSGSSLKFVADVGVFNLPAWLDNKGTSINWGNNCF